MRITAGTLGRDAAAALERTSEQLLEYQRQVSSGKRIQRASDDPAGTATAISERAEVATVEQYQRTGDSVSSRLSIMDSALSDIIDRLSYAQSQALSARGTTKTQTERDAAAQALEGVRQAIFEDLNTSFHGVYVFSGRASTTAAFAKGAGGAITAYQGSTDEVSVEIDRGRAVTVGFDASTIAQGDAAADVFETLDALITAVRDGNDSAIATAVDGIKAAFERATAAQTRVGTSMAAIEAQQLQLGERRLAGQTRISQTEDANMAEAASGLSQADVAYRAALAATAAISRQSLMDYLS